MFSRENFVPDRSTAEAAGQRLSFPCHILYRTQALARIFERSQAEKKCEAVENQVECKIISEQREIAWRSLRLGRRDSPFNVLHEKRAVDISGLNRDPGSDIPEVSRFHVFRG